LLDEVLDDFNALDDDLLEDTLALIHLNQIDRAGSAVDSTLSEGKLLKKRLIMI